LRSLSARKHEYADRDAVLCVTRAAVCECVSVAGRPAREGKKFARAALTPASGKCRRVRRPRLAFKAYVALCAY
jgi:hypothetical protein